MSIRLMSARRENESNPKWGREHVLVVVYELRHQSPDVPANHELAQPARRGTVLTVQLKIKIDEITETCTPSLTIRDFPAATDVEAALRKLGEWCGRIAAEIDRARVRDKTLFALIPALFERTDS